MKQFKDKPLLLVGIVVGIIILVTPIILNLLIFNWRSSLTNGNLDSWMGFISTYYGAVIGGVISGALTLIGVRYTIKKDEKTDFIKTYPYRRKAVDDIKEELFAINLGCRIFLNSSQGEQDLWFFRNNLNARIEKLDNLLEKSSTVDSIIYEDIRMNFSEILLSVQADIVEAKKTEKEIDKEQLEILEWVSSRSLRIAKSTADNITDRFRGLTGWN